MKLNKTLYLITLLFVICSCGTSGVISSSDDTSPNESSEEPHHHIWGDISYTWNDDNSEVTATRVCTLNQSHVEEETVSTIRTIKKEATCQETGIYLYISNTFNNAAFSIQTKETVMPIKDHDYSIFISVDDDNHTYACSMCGLEHTSVHTWDEGVIDTYAEVVHGVLIKGDMTITCTTCGHHISVKHGITEYQI